LPGFLVSFFIFGIFPIICKYIGLVLKPDQIKSEDENDQNLLSVSMLTQMDVKVKRGSKQLAFKPATPN
jgi:hypothetical protein